MSEGLCRLCAKKYSQKSLIKMDSDEFVNYNLANKIYQYFIINITDDDKFPKDVCNICFKKVLETFEFHKQIEKAQELLEDILQSKAEIKREVNNYSDSDDNYNFLFDNSLYEDKCDDDTPVSRLQSKKSEEVNSKTDASLKEEFMDIEESVKAELTIGPHESKGNSSKKRRKKDNILGRKKDNILGRKKKVQNADEEDSPESVDKEEPFICERCGKSFPRVGILNAHLKTHSEEKPFKCDECTKFFKDIYGLKKHKTCHTGIRPHVCTVCGLKFSRKWIHDRHTLRHSKTTDFECRFCSKQFKEAYYLKVHLRQHTGERPYSCTECNHFFANSSNFIKHLRGKHRLRNFSIANQHQYPFINS